MPLHKLRRAASDTGVASFSVQGTFSKGTTSGTSVTLPALIAGDLILCQDRRRVSSGSSTTAPTGYTLISNEVDGILSANLYFKVADGTETQITAPGTLTWAQFAGMVLRPDIPVLTASANDIDSELTAGTPTSQVKNCSGVAVPVVAVAGYVTDGNSLIGATSMSPTEDQSVVNSSSTCAIKAKIYNAGSTPANVTASMSDVGDQNTLISAYLTVIP